MPKYLDTRGNASLAVGICARCSKKFPIGELLLDPNNQLRVCAADRDFFDPYRLPARKTENIALRFSRPDVPLVSDPYGLPTENDDYFLVTEDGDEYMLP